VILLDSVLWQDSNNECMARRGAHVRPAGADSTPGPVLRCRRRLR